MAFKMLDAATTTGTSAIVYLPYHLTVNEHTVTASFTSGTAVTIAIEGTLDNRGVADADKKWAALATHVFDADEITAKFAEFHIANKGVLAVRLNLTTFTTAGGTLTAKYQPVYGGC